MSRRNQKWCELRWTTIDFCGFGKPFLCDKNKLSLNSESIRFILWTENRYGWYKLYSLHTHIHTNLRWKKAGGEKGREWRKRGIEGPFEEQSFSQLTITIQMNLIRIICNFSIPAFHITYEIKLNHAFAYAQHHKNLPPIIRFARWCLLFPCNLDDVNARVAVWCGGDCEQILHKWNNQPPPPPTNNNVKINGAYISIDEYDKWKMNSMSKFIIIVFTDSLCTTRWHNNR